ncbi:hypothetical protein D1114_07005 [Cereibacter sphaeroides]|uniref:Glycoside hydrolase family 19 catalytic domain-containing protein n=1 Tax=Cereibacter sphaeroides TaxID=1063 RepID=A0AAX1UMS7_CERSP|nr:hypothetical protein [Cereibacter sphaeroides]RHZ96453.1 hypothetical protein D1114_07005 [Cereibacter sphaeroides]
MKAEFFAAVRSAFGSLSQSQVDGIETLLSATIGLPIEERAYLLATAWHETARTMQPITERGSRDYFDKYEPGTRIGQVLGNTSVGDGYRFRGRGYVQITGRANYAKASRALGRELVQAPELALQPSIAAQILVQGCRDGWFTGKRLRDYLPGDYVGARRVVNGTDRATVIAGYARKFEAALARLDEATAPVTAGRSPWAALVAWLSSVFIRKGA